MFAIVVGGVLLGWFTLRMYREPRRFGNGVVLLIALIFLTLGVLDIDRESPLSLVVYLLIVTSPLLLLALAGLLMVNGVQMWRREGRRPANLLSFGLGLALLSPYALFIAAFALENAWVTALFGSIILVECYLGFVLVAFLLYAYVYLRWPYRIGMAAIVVHGSGLVGTRVPPLLAARLDRALQVYTAETAGGRTPMLVTSGGKGSDEALSEADAMADYLIAKGIPPAAILREDRSRSTRENLLYTRELLAQHREEGPIVLVTSNFHTLRTGMLARRLGLNATVVGSPTAFYYMPSAILREYAAVLVEHKWTNTLICLTLAALPPLAALAAHRS
ncbi:YdcF family protein [Nocardia huaxiensis]|uniref:YdcF family protein n=1 Tax=Nocardia huaxiensis TaxID=2755382 RepID=UPI001E346BA7|nr:YdcF family protein [Nocardia huaxiensis]UFS98244.1 YdcF family protein [Nocardia huaxiensis]